MCGSMANLDALQEICNENSLVLIEDSSQATGATYKGKPLGSIGDIGCLSLDYVKIITCGEGGAILTNNERFYIPNFSRDARDIFGSRVSSGRNFFGTAQNIPDGWLGFWNYKLLYQTNP